MNWKVDRFTVAIATTGLGLAALAYALFGTDMAIGALWGGAVSATNWRAMYTSVRSVLTTVQGSSLSRVSGFRLAFGFVPRTVALFTVVWAFIKVLEVAPEGLLLGTLSIPIGLVAGGLTWWGANDVGVGHAAR